jgi:3'-phosphoadenosine 5'-phosphosulfate sulfotransferase (PAPS reductase)/FAD synthetase
MQGVKNQNVYEYSEMQEMQSWKLDKKIEKAKEIIRETFKQGNKVALAFSGGKDSTALWHLILTTCPEQAKIWLSSLAIQVLSILKVSNLPANLGMNGAARTFTRLNSTESRFHA